MPRRTLLSLAEQDSLLKVPTNQDDLIRYYTFSENDLSIIKQHRGEANRLGFAILLCYMRYPGIIIEVNKLPDPLLLNFVARQLSIPIEVWNKYGKRPETRRDHILELQSLYGYKLFTKTDYKLVIEHLKELAWQTDKGIILATALVQFLRQKLILIPSTAVIDRICSEVVTLSIKYIQKTLTESLTDEHRYELDSLLTLRMNRKVNALVWLRQPPGMPNPKHMVEHIHRLKEIEKVMLPAGLEYKVHQNRFLKLAREGNQMTVQHLRDLEPARRYATLIAILLETKATIIDEIVDLHDRMIGGIFNKAKHSHAQQFQESGKAINEKVGLYWKIGNALMEAKQAGSDPFIAIESILPWEDFAKSINEAKKLSQSEDFDYLPKIIENYNTVRRYSPGFLKALQFKAMPAAQEILDAVDVLKTMNEDQARKVPDDVPTDFIGKRWSKLIFADNGINRKFYELCVLSELKNALRSGDIWVKGSRQFKDFDEYLLPLTTFNSLKELNELPLAVVNNSKQYLHERMLQLEQQLDVVSKLAKSNELPDAIITDTGLKITPLTTIVPSEAEALIQKIYSLLPHVKITELLLEVDEWTNFTQHFTHIKNGETVKDKTLLLTAILADGINLGLTKMAESCPGITYSNLSWLQAWYIRDETYSAALGELVNAQSLHPLAVNWGDGTTSSSDGQRFKVGSHALGTGHINPKYGSDKGIQFYTHISDQYAPFHTNVINVGVRDATYVLDGLLYHESDLRIEEHYTDTAGFTDHVFGLMHLLGFRFAPRIRDLADKRLYVPPNYKSLILNPLIGGIANVKLIDNNWDDILRLATSIKQGTVTASLMLRKLGSYPRQNGLALALREIGRIERTLFTLDWLQNVELRRRVHTGLNKGEAKNALARAVFFNRLGEMRDRNFENQRYRASGLNLLVAAIILWNTVYLERAIQELRARGHTVDDKLLKHLSPLGWGHINLTGDYVWSQNKDTQNGNFRPLKRALLS